MLPIVILDAGQASPVTDVLVAGVPASVVIVLLVEICKRCGLDRRYSPLLSIVFGVLFMMLTQVVRVLPGLRGWYEAAGAGLMLGLTACGLYSGSKAMIVKRASRYRELPTGDVIDHARVVGE